MAAREITASFPITDMIENLSKVIPQLVFIALAFAFIGWSIRGKANKPAPAKNAKPAPTNDKGQQDRAKNLEAALEKSKVAHKALKSELENLQNNSVSKATLETATAELETARKALETETKRISSLEADLKKAQDTIRNLNSRANDADKAQKDRKFALENELSKTREQLAIFQNRPDDRAELHSEIERLRESVAASTRFAGEMRKREAAAVEALEKAESRLADLSDPSRPAPVSKKIGPVVDSGRIAAAKAEVIRLVEMNKLKETAVIPAIAAVAVVEATAEEVKLPVVEAEAPLVEAEVPVVEAEAPAAESVVSEVAASEPQPAVIEEEPVADEATPAMKEAPANDELFALD